MKDRKKIEGKVRYVSCSPHGDPEGVVLESGEFVKIPPHSLTRKELITEGARIAGTAELIATAPNPVFHHARLEVSGKLVSDDSLDGDAKEELKEKHKADLKARQKTAERDAPSQTLRFSGVVVAVGTKKKGEVDRLIFGDGTSVHLGKDLDLDADDVTLGESFEVKGEARVYGKRRFVRAESVRSV